MQYPVFSTTEITLLLKKTRLLMHSSIIQDFAIEMIKIQFLQQHKYFFEKIPTRYPIDKD